jgi:methylmalonyl-CoA/ethylmalonyl-CoA epimerase
LPTIKRIDHIAVIVEDLETTLGFWRDALGIELTGVEEAAEEAARVAFLPVGGSQVELVEPTVMDSSLKRFLERRGPGMHHICLEVDDLQGMLDQLRERGVQLVNETPRIGSEGRKYAFIHPKSAFGVMVELYELP